jgi:hypothetical protein
MQHNRSSGQCLSGNLLWQREESGFHLHPSGAIHIFIKNAIPLGQILQGIELSMAWELFSE